MGSLPGLFWCRNIFANMAAEKDSMYGLIFAKSINSDMNIESIVLPNSRNGENITWKSLKTYIVRSPLYWACYHKNLRMLKFLIDSKVNLFHRSKYLRKNNPLFVAIEKGFIEGVKLLIANRFRYTNISNGSLRNFYEMLQDTTTMAFERT